TPSGSIVMRHVTKVTCCPHLASTYNPGKPGPSDMSDPRIEEIVRSAVALALERQLVSLRETVIQDVLREVGPALKGQSGSAAGSSAALQKAISAIQAGTTQKEILRTLLENTILYSQRAALFVVKNGSATGWQGIAFGNNEAVKDFSLDLGSNLSSR